jgi:phage terminase large subunit
MQTELTIPDKLEPLLQPKRYKIIYGGRGSAKSWTVARILLALGATRCLRVLCCREIQKSISESVHQLLRDQIEALGLSHHYTITANAIVGKNGTQFFFAGLKHNIDSIKSKEGIDVVWVEEAHSVSKRSWEKLIPTIRKPGSEIWVVFNPELDTDDTWRRFIVNGANDPRVLKILMNWRDNDWFTGELEAERIALRQSDPDGYLTVYEGHCRQTLEGAIYAKELRAAQAEGRITTVPYDRSMPVFTAWDLGFRDRTSIWFVQMIGFQYRIIDFCEAQRTSLEDWLKLLQQRGYLYDTHFLPHDGDNESMASRSIATLMRNANHKVITLPRTAIADGINAVRTVFPQCVFDQEKTADGLNNLRRYTYDVHPDTGLWSKNPKHDDHSHAADAFRYFAMSLKERPKTAPRQRVRVGSWMGA